VSSVLFVFLDGVGLAPAGPHNPFTAVGLPRLAAHLGHPFAAPADGADRPIVDRPGLLLTSLDAQLGVPGLPQSATGQTALFTGVNAAARVGEHVTAWPTAPLRAIIAEHSLLRRVIRAGGQATFANAYSARYWEMVRQRKRRLSVSTLSALAADVSLRTLDDLRHGQAVLWDITHEVAQRLGYDLPPRPAADAAANLLRLAARHHLTVYESFLTDLAGHGRLEPAWVLGRVDRFLAALVGCLPSDLTLVVSSDHGNLEDTSTQRHTKNRVPLLVAGPAASAFRSATAITDLAPLILRLLQPDDQPAYAQG
jgi:2,3-bisphosphoglycerate-independent phosphoglycerate mutase